MMSKLFVRLYIFIYWNLRLYLFMVYDYTLTLWLNIPMHDIVQYGEGSRNNGSGVCLTGIGCQVPSAGNTFPHWSFSFFAYKQYIRHDIYLGWELGLLWTRVTELWRNGHCPFQNNATLFYLELSFFLCHSYCHWRGTFIYKKARAWLKYVQIWALTLSLFVRLQNQANWKFSLFPSSAKCGRLQAKCSRLFICPILQDCDALHLSVVSCFDGILVSNGAFSILGSQ